MNNTTIFGIRHLSPTSAYNLYRELERVKPDIVLIEGPSDLSNKIKYFCNNETKFPIAILSYTQTLPVHSIIYPFAIYSPEVQAIFWAYENNVECRFIDLPSYVFLAFREINEKRVLKNNNIAFKNNDSIYKKLENFLGQDYNTFWERNFEHLKSLDYIKALEKFGNKIRENKENNDNFDFAENLVRESYMKRNIIKACNEGFKNIFCVCGAYHIEGIKNIEPMNDIDEKNLPKLENTNSTLMPYSYYRLSEHSGYGAGNQAPAYFEFIWDSFFNNDINETAYKYMTYLASKNRKLGNIISSASVIEAVRLSRILANIRGSKFPVLEDLRDAAITCIGNGSFSKIAVATAEVEIGTKIGSLPNNVINTSIQVDFYRAIKNLHLDRFRTNIKTDLELDLRENIFVKSEKSAFLDLYRSFFLHRLRVLEIDFGNFIFNNKNQSTWKECWSLQWTPEVEIQIVEASLLGETIENAAFFKLKDKSNKSLSISEISDILQDAFLCGFSNLCEFIISSLQKLAIDTYDIITISKTSENLSNILRYGDLRKFDAKPIIPILSQLYYRACLILEDCCNCNNDIIKEIIESIERLNNIQLKNDFLDEKLFVDLLFKISNRDNINTQCSGFAMAILIERGKISENLIIKEISRRLSKGVPADLGAGWFEGLSKKNKYSLITRISLWKELDNYLNTLNDDEFKRALVFLRRAFCDFTASEKSDISENLGEIWGYNSQQVSGIIMTELNEYEKEFLDNIEDFDFDNI